MSQLPDNSPPLYELYDPSQRDTPISVIQNFNSYTESLEKFCALATKRHKLYKRLYQSKIPLTFDDKVQWIEICEEYAAEIMVFTGSFWKMKSHGHTQFYTAISGTSEDELDQSYYEAIELNTTLHRRPELTWNLDVTTNGHGNLENKSSRVRKLCKAVKRAWVRLKG